MVNSDTGNDFLSRYNAKVNEEILKNFFIYEFCFLSNNKSLNPQKFKKNSRIYITSFDNYYTLPMVLNRAIFKAIDEKENECINISEYVEGMMAIYTGEINERVVFIYKLLKINEDEFVHKVDVKLILSYTHIFCGKTKQDLLTTIIDDFFGDHSLFNFPKFVNNIKKRNSDLIFLIMCIFFEHQTFNTNILDVLEGENNPALKKNTESFNINSSSKFCKDIGIETLYDLAPPTQNAVEYIQANYGISLSDLRKEKETNKDILEDKSIDSIEFDDIHDQELDLAELNDFESDMHTAKEFYIEKALDIELDLFEPKCGSNYFTFKSGELISVPSDGKSHNMSSNKSFNFNLNHNKSSNGLSSFFNGTVHKSSNNSIPHVGSGKSGPGSFNENSSGNLIEVEDMFREEVMVINEKNAQKKYTLGLVRGFLVVMKKKLGNVLTVGNTQKLAKIKRLIPLRHLYVSGIEEGIVFNEIIYNKLTIVSTVKRIKEEYFFYMERIKRLNELVKMIIMLTNYISVSSDFTFVKDVGKGGFCQIKLMKHNQTNKLYAIKKLNKQTKSIEDFTCQNWEKDIVTFLQNFPEKSNIIQFHKIIETINHLYIVMQYIESGSLGHFVKKIKTCISSTKVKEIARQLFSGLTHLHDYGIVHRDIKLENILIDFKDENNFQIKIIDFGLSQVLTPMEKTSQPYGTLLYCSPEVLMKLDYNNKIDIWSVGILLYYLEYTTMPFGIRGKEKNQEICRLILMSKLKIPEKSVSSSIEDKKTEAESIQIMKAVISGALCKDINQRLTSKEIYNLLSKR